MVKAIAVDMDGTFLDSKKTYDKLRFEAIFTELRNRDITFIAASGNQYAKLKSIFGDRDMYFISEMVQLFIMAMSYIIIKAIIVRCFNRLSIT